MTHVPKAKYVENADIEQTQRSSHCYRDTCPTCKNAKLDYDPGHGDTRDETGQPPACFCPQCGDTFEVDFERQEKRELAMQISRDLFTNGTGQIATRLVLMNKEQYERLAKQSGSRDMGGWCESAVEDRIFAALSLYHDRESI